MTDFKPERLPWREQHELEEEAFVLLATLYEARHKPNIDWDHPTNRYRQFADEFDHIMREASATLQQAVLNWGKVR